MREIMRNILWFQVFGGWSNQRAPFHFAPGRCPARSSVHGFLGARKHNTTGARQIQGEGAVQGDFDADEGDCYAILFQGHTGL